MVGLQVADSSLASWVLAITLVGATAVVWGLLLSPRRRVDLPLWARVAIEVALFAAAAAGLMRAGYAGWGAALFLAELVVLTAMWAMGMPPGRDPGGRRGESDEV